MSEMTGIIWFVSVCVAFVAGFSLGAYHENAGQNLRRRYRR